MRSLEFELRHNRLQTIVFSSLYSMKDGRLLQPTRPALSLDSTFVQRAFGSGGPNGHISVAYTEVETPLKHISLI